MRKHYQLTLAVLALLPVLAGCHSMQGPTKESTITPSGTLNPRYSSNPDGGFTTPLNPSPGTNESIPALGGGAQNSALPGNIDWSNPPAELLVATVHFGFNEYNIQSADRAALEAAAKKMAADPSLHVVAVGHCDWYGSEEYNLALGERRSNSVKNFLGKNGASAASIEILSMGQAGAVPNVGKQSAEAKHDRRVDLVRIPAGTTLPTGPAKPAGEGS